MRPRRLNQREREVRLRILDRIDEAVAHYRSATSRPFSDLALARAQLGDLDGALRLARRIGESPRDPRLADKPFVLATIAAARRKAGDVSASDEAFREALNLIAGDPKLRSRLPQVASIQAESGDTAGAVRTVGTMGPDVAPRELAVIARYCADSGDSEAARSLFGRALERAEAIINGTLGQPAASPAAARHDGDQAGVEACSILAMVGDLESAARTLGAIVEPRARHAAARAIVRERTKAGDVEQALGWALAREGPEMRAAALTGLADAVEEPR
jgi:hypothetical protein